MVRTDRLERFVKCGDTFLTLASRNFISGKESKNLALNNVVVVSQTESD